MAKGGVYSEPAAEAWRKRISEFDAFVAIVAEYNHGPTAVLKNSFDSALNEWQRKPIAFVGYGGGAAVLRHQSHTCTRVWLQQAAHPHDQTASMCETTTAPP